MLLNHFIINKGLPSIVRDFHELCVFIRKAFPSIVRDFLISKVLPSIARISFRSKAIIYIVRE